MNRWTRRGIILASAAGGLSLAAFGLRSKGPDWLIRTVIEDAFGTEVMRSAQAQAFVVDFLQQLASNDKLTETFRAKSAIASLLPHALRRRSRSYRDFAGWIAGSFAHSSTVIRHLEAGKPLDYLGLYVWPTSAYEHPCENVLSANWL